MSKLIIKLDASALKESACMLRLNRIVIEGYREPIVANDIQFGTAIHKFIDTVFKTKDFALAYKLAGEIYSVPMMVKAKKQYMTQGFLKNVCFYLWEKFLSKDDFEVYTEDNVPIVERGFSLPYYSDDLMDVLLTGTWDRLGKKPKGNSCIRDYKSTTYWDVKDFLSSFKLSPQLLFYIFVLKQYQIQKPDSIIGQIGAQTNSAIIDGVFVKTQADLVDYHSSEEFIFKEPQLIEFKSLLDKTIQEIKTGIQNPHTLIRQGMINGACETKYGKCKFFDVCASPDDITAAFLLQKNFIQKPYDPLSFNKI